MISNISLPYTEFFEAAREQLPFMGYMLLGLWVFNIINWLLCRSNLNALGIYPRSTFGLIGIVFAPIPHGNFNHLFFNSIPFFALGMIILGLGRDVFLAVTVLTTLMSGAIVWLIGRKCLHIGISGVISGYFGFLLCLAYLYPTLISLVLALVVLYYFGSIITGIIPTSDAISWECHLAGLVSGVAVMYCFWYIPGFEAQVLSLFSFAQ